MATTTIVQAMMDKPWGTNFNLKTVTIDYKWLHWLSGPRGRTSQTIELFSDFQTNNVEATRRKIVCETKLSAFMPNNLSGTYLDLSKDMTCWHVHSGRKMTKFKPKIFCRYIYLMGFFQLCCTLRKQINNQLSPLKRIIQLRSCVTLEDLRVRICFWTFTNNFIF